MAEVVGPIRAQVPEECIACRSRRIGIQEGRAHYACGTVLEFFLAKPKLVRTPRCFGAARELGIGMYLPMSVRDHRR
jgi:hypothetical protein